MGFLEMLDKYKDQFIDAAKLEELKSVFRVMERTNKELEANNKALTERKKILQEKIQILESDSAKLSKLIKEYEEQLKELEKGEAPKQKYSNNASAVLSFFLDNDKTKGYELSIIDYLRGKGFSEIKIKGGIAELRGLKIILPFSTHPTYGPEWNLTDECKMLLAR